MISPAFDITSPLRDLVEITLKEGPQVVSRDGVETAVLVSIEDWNRLKPKRDNIQSAAKRTLKDILLDPNGPHDLYIPSRGQLRMREPIDFE